MYCWHQEPLPRLLPRIDVPVLSRIWHVVITEVIQIGEQPINVPEYIFCEHIQARSKQ